MPFSAWVCITHCASWRAAWIALWIVKPAGLTANSDSSSLLPCASILIRLDAVISSNIRPYGLIRNESWLPGSRALMWVKTRSSHLNAATSR